jgi:hypothetical protein
MLRLPASTTSAPAARNAEASPVNSPLAITATLAPEASRTRRITPVISGPRRSDQITTTAGLCRSARSTTRAPSATVSTAYPRDRKTPAMRLATDGLAQTRIS